MAFQITAITMTLSVLEGHCKPFQMGIRIARNFSFWRIGGLKPKDDQSLCWATCSMA